MILTISPAFCHLVYKNIASSICLKGLDIVDITVNSYLHFLMSVIKITTQIIPSFQKIQQQSKSKVKSLKILEISLIISVSSKTFVKIIIQSNIKKTDCKH